MHHIIRGAKVSILVMLDQGDSILRAKYLPNDSARTAFTAYFSRWIAIFDSPVYTIVDRGRNLTNKLMADELRALNSQFCLIPTEAPWSIGSNERSHKYLHRCIDKLTHDPSFDCGPQYEILLGELEMAWNFSQHSNRILPHYHRFGIMPRILGELSETQTVRQRIALMEIAREQTEAMRADHVIRSANNSSRRHVLKLNLFTVNQKVWFYRQRHGWREGTVTRIDRPTIFVTHKKTMYPTHETRVRPYFGELSIPPDVLNDDPDIHELLEKPCSSNTTPCEPVPPREPHHGNAPVSELLNGIFCSSHPIGSPASSNILQVESTSVELHLTDSSYGTRDSNTIHLTTATFIKNIRKLPPDQQQKFLEAQLEEIKFLLKRAVTRIPLSDISPSCELQPLKWIFAIKRSPKTERYRARLVSTSHRSQYRHSVHGNAPTVANSTIRFLYAIIPTWQQRGKRNNDPIQVFTRDIATAYLQSDQTKRLIYYQPPKEYFQHFPDSLNRVWKAIVQLYGEVEAAVYWNKTFVPWIVNNILDLRQSLYDPSLFYNPTRDAAILLCTDDTNNVIPLSALKTESRVAERFECHPRQQLPTDFKGMDLAIEASTIILSQTAYLDSLSSEDCPYVHTKPELTREMNNEELSFHRKTAGKLAWIAKSTSPQTAFTSSIALQGSKKPVSILHETFQALRNAQSTRLAKLTFVPLDYDIIHIRVYSDGSFQNLKEKHSQIGFLIGLADKDHRFNIFHWQSSRASRRPHSTEESELLALDAAFRCLTNMRMLVLELLKKTVPVVTYLDNQTLWSNLMNRTVATLPEVMYRCRDYIHNETVNSICLIPGAENPANAMTKSKPNTMLSKVITTNTCRTPPTRVFMLQTFPFRHANYIPTSRVPMPDDDLDETISTCS